MVKNQDAQLQLHTLTHINIMSMQNASNFIVDLYHMDVSYIPRQQNTVLRYIHMYT